MASMRVLRFPRGDKDSAHVLVNVSSAGPKPLDLKLTATEGDEPYTCVLKHDGVSSLRVENCPASEDEWEHILFALLQKDPVEDIQVAAAVQPETSVSLTVRKQVQGITQRLGAILLKCDQSKQIELFQWCDWSLGTFDKHRKEAVDSAVKAREMEAEVAGLRAQLDELVQAKQDDEAALLLKSRDLLNEKKVKIREPQRIITASSFKLEDPAFSQPLQGETIGQPTVRLHPGLVKENQRRKTWPESLETIAIRPWRMLPSSQSQTIRTQAIPVMARHQWATTRTTMEPPSREPLVTSSPVDPFPRPATECDKRHPPERQLEPPLLGEICHLQINKTLLHP